MKFQETFWINDQESIFSIIDYNIVDNSYHDSFGFIEKPLDIEDFEIEVFENNSDIPDKELCEKVLNNDDFINQVKETILG